MKLVFSKVGYRVLLSNIGIKKRQNADRYSCVMRYVTLFSKG